VHFDTDWRHLPESQINPGRIRAVLSHAELPPVFPDSMHCLELHPTRAVLVYRPIPDRRMDQCLVLQL
jgi:hypothetical protein